MLRCQKDYSPKIQAVNLIFNGITWAFLRKKASKKISIVVHCKIEFLTADSIIDSGVKSKKQGEKNKDQKYCMREVKWIGLSKLLNEKEHFKAGLWNAQLGQCLMDGHSRDA